MTRKPGSGKLIIGTRGSALALWQARHVAASLEEAHGGLEVDLQIIRTRGDRETRLAPRQFSDKGIFVKEIEDALLREEIDLAVHSMKDVPSEQPDGLGLVAFPPRVDCRDALVTRDGLELRDLAAGARVGTGSLRRRAQLARARPDLVFVEIRGNVDTRLRKVEEGEVDAVVLAMAGLTRLGLAADRRVPLEPEVCLPAPGQGALALEARLGDRRLAELVAGVDHSPTRQQVAAERAVLAALDAGCLAPLAALARPETGGALSVAALVASPNGTTLLRATATGAPDRAAAIGQEAAARLRAAGADAVLAAARRQAAAEDPR